jgi:hypothetical protein
MLKALASFISDIYSLLTPEMALAGGVPFPPSPVQEKPSLSLHKGGTAFNLWNWTGGFKGAHLSPYNISGQGGNNPTTKPPPPPPPPNLAIPTPPVPPTPASPPSSADTNGAMADGYANAQKGFGYKASLLRGAKDPATNTATGTGSLLGN